MQCPSLESYEKLFRYTRKLWTPREEGRFGGVVEPMLHWAKVRTARESRQVVPCTAGKLSAVIYANGDVGMCESLPSLGNLRNNAFNEIWYSKDAKSMRRSIRKKDCFRTNEIFLCPSLTFQLLQLIKAMIGSKVWKKTIE